MKRILLAASLATVLGGAEVSVQTPGTSTPAANQSQQLTINGCVYAVANDATTFTFERTADADTTGTQPSTAKPADQVNVRGATGTTGTTTMSPGGAAGTGTAGPAPATWYRLASGPSTGFGEFVGKAVRIRGTVAAASGADASRSSGTSGQPGTPAPIPAGAPAGADLKAAPQLIVQDITAVEGQCRASAAAPPSR